MKGTGKGKDFSVKRASRTLEELYERYRGQKGTIIPILQDIQEKFGYLPEDAVNWIADRLGIPRSNFFGVATFYAQFYLAPRGRNIITACSGTACHVKGSERIINSMRRDLELSGDKNTTDDMEFTVEKVNCVGACSIAPVIIINKKVHGKASSTKLLKEIKKLKKKKE